MKCILFFLFVLPLSIYSQDTQIKISYQSQDLNISLDDDNTGKLITIAKPLSDSNIVIHVINDEIDKDWKRNFIIYNAEDSAVKDFTLMKKGSYCVKTKEVLNSLKQNEIYFIYTTAFPNDPKKAMLIKVSRVLVCKIKLVN